MPKKLKAGEKRVKAWIFLQEVRKTLKPCPLINPFIFTKKRVALKKRSDKTFFVGRCQIVPCTITYTLPTKKTKK